VNHQLGDDQQRDHDEELDVRVDVLEEGHGDAPAQQMPLQPGRPSCHAEWSSVRPMLTFFLR